MSSTRVLVVEDETDARELTVRGLVRLGFQAEGAFDGRDALDRLERVLAGNFDLAHVADVEQTAGRTHRRVLFGSTAVGDGHLPPSEVHHAGTEAAVHVVQRCPATHSTNGRARRVRLP